MSAGPPTPAPPVPDEGPSSAADTFANRLGVRLLDWSDGSATAELVIGPEHVNALGVTHGGALFGLADATLARASNHAGEPAVVVAAHMQFLRATRPGDRLVAVAGEEYRGGRLGAYRVDVRCGGELVATASGTALRVSPHIGTQGIGTQGVGTRDTGTRDERRSR